MHRHLAAMLFIISIFAAPAWGQFMYLDANGDGINSATERLNAVGNTTLDVWLDTAHNRDGSDAGCSDGVSSLLTCSLYCPQIKIPISAGPFEC